MAPFLPSLFLDLLLWQYLRNLSYLSISSGEFEGDFEKSQYCILILGLFYKCAIRKSQGLVRVSKNDVMPWHCSDVSVLIALRLVPGAGLHG